MVRIAYQNYYRGNVVVQILEPDPCLGFSKRFLVGLPLMLYVVG